jgi:hypothetical protein
MNDARTAVPDWTAEPAPVPPGQAAEIDTCPNFDRLAGLYRWMELFSFGPLLQRCRCARLAQMSGRRRALILGDGDGRFTSRLLGTNDEVKVAAVDGSPAMLRALMRGAGQHAGRVRTDKADARCFAPSARDFDLVATHFFLDCLTTEDVQLLAETIRRSVTDDAIWVVSEFAIPSGQFRRLLARPLVGFLYRAFGCLTGLRVRSLPDHAAALAGAGFQLEDRRTWLGGLLVSEIWAVRRMNHP